MKNLIEILIMLGFLLLGATKTPTKLHQSEGLTAVVQLPLDSPQTLIKLLFKDS